MKLTILVILVLVSLNTFSQIKKCGSDVLNLRRIQNDPALIEKRFLSEAELQKNISQNRKKRLEITIPVVVHVIYNSESENVSDNQIFSQIEALNRDYKKTNPDTLINTHPFYSLAGGMNVNFVLATVDPNGKATSGITRTKTSKVSWGNDDLNYDNMKFTSTGGIENWSPTKYLNIYTVRFADSVQLLGYAYFPEDLASYPETDGVVVDFRCFGTNGTAGIEGFDAYKLGRTVTHEVGHWLGLRHIWGDLVYESDKKCGNDLVNDTPPAEGDNSGEPTFPHRANNKCGSDSNGEMYMNYMDYVHDKSMVMFSKGQISRMEASMNTYRKYFIQKAEISSIEAEEIVVKKNPFENVLELTLQNHLNGEIKIFDLVGNLCFLSQFDKNSETIDLSMLKSGEYILVLNGSDFLYRSKIIKM